MLFGHAETLQGIETTHVRADNPAATVGCIEKTLSEASDQFTNGGQAALAVLTYQVEKSGRCDLAIGHLASLAGVSETTVRRAFREAKRLGLIQI